jgi:hypothetical protein
MARSLLSHLLNFRPAAVLMPVSPAEAATLDELIPLFETFKAYPAVELTDAAVLQHAGERMFLILIRIRFEFKGIKYPLPVREVFEEELAGVLLLKDDCGRAVIRPETLTDKANELFGRQETDFPEDPEFSNRFYVLCSDENRFRSAFPEGLRRVFTDFRPVEAEINGKVLIVRMRKPVSEETIRTITEFLNSAATVINA